MHLLMKFSRLVLRAVARSGLSLPGPVILSSLNPFHIDKSDLHVGCILFAGIHKLVAYVPERRGVLLSPAKGAFQLIICDFSSLFSTWHLHCTISCESKSTILSHYIAYTIIRMMNSRDLENKSILM